MCISCLDSIKASYNVYKLSLLVSRHPTMCISCLASVKASYNVYKFVLIVSRQSYNVYKLSC